MSWQNQKEKNNFIKRVTEFIKNICESDYDTTSLLEVHSQIQILTERNKPPTQKLHSLEYYEKKWMLAHKFGNYDLIRYYENKYNHISHY